MVFSGVPVVRLVTGGGGELLAGGDGEFLVGVGEVPFDGAGGDEQVLGDVAVGQAGGGELGDAALAGCQRVEPAQDEPPGSSPAVMSSVRARSVSASAPQRWARSSACRRISRLSARCPARSRAAPRWAMARACYSRASEPSSTRTASMPRFPPSARPAARRATRSRAGRGMPGRARPPRSRACRTRSAERRGLLRSVGGGGRCAWLRHLRCGRRAGHAAFGGRAIGH